MLLDADGLVDWDFGFKLGGAIYHMRPPTLGELTRLSSRDGAGTIESKCAAVDMLIIGEKPVWMDNELPDVLAAHAAYETYLRAHIEKKRAAAQAAAVGTVPIATSTAGASLPR